MEGLWLKTGNPLYHQMARFWTRVFALTFAIGVATGIVMEFEFGTNWATYSRYVGDVFGSALAAEGIDPDKIFYYEAYLPHYRGLAARMEQFSSMLLEKEDRASHPADTHADRAHEAQSL